MQLIHLTAKRFKNLTADSIYVSNLTRQFNKSLPNDYMLIVGNKLKEQFIGVNVIDLHISSWGNGLLYFWLPYLFYFFWLPYFILKKKINNSEKIFFSSDANLLVFIIWWRKIFRFKFKICSDWHMMHNNFKDNYIAKNSEYIITTSEKLKKNMVNKLGISPTKIQVVYGGVDLSVFENDSRPEASLRKDLGLPESDILVGYVGFYKTMGMSKGIETMIDALRFISDENIKMVFVGGRGREIEEYGDFTLKLGLSTNRTIFVPAVSSEATMAYERAMDILVIPYPNKPHFRDFGFPMKVYEYMASRRPVIYSKLDLVEEVIGDCALGFEADNAKDLAQKIVELETNTTLSADLANRAYEKVEEYSWQKKAENILEFIKK